MTPGDLHRAVIRYDELGWGTPPDVRRTWRMTDGMSIHVRADGLWLQEGRFWWRLETFLTFWPPRWRKPRYKRWKP